MSLQSTITEKVKQYFNESAWVFVYDSIYEVTL